MIEVEKSFDPTEEQLKKILEGAEFLGEVVNHDIYYDFPDLRMAKNKIKLRYRNGVPELKIEKSEFVDEEVEDVGEIQKFFGTEEILDDYVKKNMQEIANYKNSRRKYKKEDINIDVDNLDFGMKCCDFEIMVSFDSEIEKAKARISEFARSFGLDPALENIGKRRAYLKKIKPEIYQELYEK